MMTTDKERREQRTKMLMVANHLQARAESAYMEHDDVCMTPREVSALAGDIERWASLIDHLTCHLVEDDDGYTACSECGCTALYMLDASYCPECGARVVK